MTAKSSGVTRRVVGNVLVAAGTTNGADCISNGGVHNLVRLTFHGKNPFDA